MSSTTPGWYPDPDPAATAGRQRWFDGAGWTEHVSTPAATPVDRFAPVYTASAAQAPGYGSAAPAPVQAPGYGSASPAPVQAPGYGSAATTPYAPFAVQAPVYGSPAPVAMPYAPAVGAYGAGPLVDARIVVGSMSPAEVKALPRKERNSKDRPDLDLARGRNQLTYNGMLLGIISLVVNPLLLLSILAIVWSVRGSRRADEFQRQGYPPLGRGQGAAGLVLGIVGTVLGALLLLARLSSI